MTKVGLKRATGVDTPKLAAKSYLGRLKTEVNKIHIDKPFLLIQVC